MTFRELHGDEQCEQLRQRLEDFFESSDGGFVIIGNNEKNRVSDAYDQVCDEHVLDRVHKVVADARRIGLIGHHHPKPEGAQQ